MIQKEYLNDGTLVKHYSDAGFMLLQNETGADGQCAVCPLFSLQTNPFPCDFRRKTAA